jgi:hypothetical protein
VSIVAVVFERPQATRQPGWLIQGEGEGEGKRELELKLTQICTDLTAQPLTTTGRPCVFLVLDLLLLFFWFGRLSTHVLTLTRRPFNGANTQCFLAQYFNALYVLDGDTSLPNAVHIFNFVSRSWSTLTVQLNGVSHQDVVAILDRDTNVFFGLHKGMLYKLDMATLNASDSSTRSWESVATPPFMDTINYTQPVLALAQNHIHFLNIGQPSQADIFVIHFAYFQPEVQSYPGLNGASSFPSTHGQTASVFKGSDAVQTKFAFWPDDKSSTYVIDVLVRK